LWSPPLLVHAETLSGAEILSLAEERRLQGSPAPPPPQSNSIKFSQLNNNQSHMMVHVDRAPLSWIPDPYTFGTTVCNELITIREISSAEMV
jgi:hypothetical protein